jgi:hypothetical protein
MLIKADVTAPANCNSAEELRDQIMGIITNQCNRHYRFCNRSQIKTEEINEIKHLQALVGNLQAKVNCIGRENVSSNQSW